MDLGFVYNKQFHAWQMVYKSNTTTAEFQLDVPSHFQFTMHWPVIITLWPCRPVHLSWGQLNSVLEERNSDFYTAATVTQSNLGKISTICGILGKFAEFGGSKKYPFEPVQLRNFYVQNHSNPFRPFGLRSNYIQITFNYVRKYVKIT